MKSLVKNILQKNFNKANEIFENKIEEISNRLLFEEKRRIASEIFEVFSLNEGRFKIVRARIRNGKVQRRKKISNLKGYTFRKKGKGPARLVRMSPSERRKRRMGQRRGKIKRRAKLARIRIKQKRALRKRRSMGLK